MDWSHLGFTSGRRTYRGNKLVGGVANSDHLRGTAADFTAPLSVLQAQFPGKRILDEGDHRHVAGLSDVPYHGRRGTVGLVNGVDTTAPKANAMFQPSQPRQRTLDPVTRAMQAPLALDAQNPLSLAQAGPGPGATDLQHKPGFLGKGGTGWALLGILGDALAGYGGQRGIFAPAMLQERENEREDSRFRERLAAETETRRQERLAKAQEPPGFVQDAEAFAQLSPQQREQVIRMRDALYPVVADVQGADGSVVRQQIPRSVGPMPGDVEDGHVYLGGDPANPNSWRPM